MKKITALRTHAVAPRWLFLKVETEAAVARAAQTGHRWSAPVWRHKDGSIAEC